MSHHAHAFTVDEFVEKYMAGSAATWQREYVARFLFHYNTDLMSAGIQGGKSYVRDALVHFIADEQLAERLRRPNEPITPLTSTSED